MPESMYRQIAEDLRLRIEKGELSHGDQLPTEIELREKYDASRNTVRDAVKWLMTRGLVETRPGQGTFVVAKIEPYVTILTGEADRSAGDGDIYINEVKATRRSPTATVPRVEIQQITGVVAEELQVEENTMVVSRHQQRSIDGIPFSLQTSFYPMSLVQRGATRLIQAEDIPQGVVAYLSDQLEVRQVGYRDKVTVRAPDPNETAYFKLPDDGRVPVFEVRRTAFDQTGHPCRLTVSVYPADRNQFTINVGEAPPEIPAASGQH